MKINFKNQKNQQGFTLIELLVVIAIIAVLAAVVITAVNSARARGRDSQRISDIRQLTTALELYSTSNSYQYIGRTNFVKPDNTNPLVTGGYIPKMPKDPSTGAPYSYFGLNNGSGNACVGYHLGATLESGNAVLNTDADASPSTGCNGNGAVTDFSGADPMYDLKK